MLFIFWTGFDLHSLLHVNCKQTPISPFIHLFIEKKKHQLVSIYSSTYGENISPKESCRPSNAFQLVSPSAMQSFWVSPENCVTATLSCSLQDVVMNPAQFICGTGALCLHHAVISQSALHLSLLILLLPPFLTPMLRRNSSCSV